jgi:hypothetical protein
MRFRVSSTYLFKTLVEACNLKEFFASSSIKTQKKLVTMLEEIKIADLPNNGKKWEIVELLEYM